MTQRYHKFKRSRVTWFACDNVTGNAVNFFSAVELVSLLADREWLPGATETIGQLSGGGKCLAE